MEICYITALYLSQICIIMASYMKHRCIWWRLNDTAQCVNRFLIVKELVGTWKNEKALVSAFFAGIVTHREGSLTALIQTSFFSRCSGCGVKRVSPRFPAQAAQCAMAGNLHKNVRDATAALLSRPMEQWSILTLPWPRTGHTLPLSHSSSHITWIGLFVISNHNSTVLQFHSKLWKLSR